MKTLFSATLVCFLLSSLSIADSDKVRTNKRVGVIAGVYSSPAPSALSGSIALNTFSFLRLNGGAGFANSGISNTPRYVYNYTAAPAVYGVSWIGKSVMYALAWVFDGFGRLVTTGKISKHLQWNDFWPGMTMGKYKMKYLPTFAAESYGGGGQFLVPGWKLSPALGVQWAHVSASKGNPYGVIGSTSHVYYTGGIDWQADSGFNLGAGYNYCPALSSAACGGYVNLGKFF